MTIWRFRRLAHSVGWPFGPIATILIIAFFAPMISVALVYLVSLFGELMVYLLSDTP